MDKSFDIPSKTDTISISKRELIELLKTVDGLKRKLQELVK